MSERLKDLFFTQEFFDDFTDAFKTVYPPFDAKTFLSRIYDARLAGKITGLDGTQFKAEAGSLERVPQCYVSNTLFTESVMPTVRC